MRLLHISDLHASSDHDLGQRRVVEGFLDDLSLRNAETPFDVVVFSGDLANRGSAEEFVLGDDLLIGPTLAALGLTESDLIMVPGNHDVDRGQINEYEEDGLRAKLTSDEEVDALLAQPQKLSSATQRLGEWASYLDRRYGDHPPKGPFGGLAFVREVEHGGQHIGILALNSAWRASGDDDERHLIIGASAARRALEYLNGCDLIVAVSHHPLHWLAHFDESAVRNALDGRPLLFLSGHEHAADPYAETRTGSSVIFSRAGCLYETTKHLNAYTVVDFDPDSGEVEICVRSWWPNRSTFDVATNITEGGRFQFSTRTTVSVALTHPPFNIVRSSLAEMAQASSESAAIVTLEEILVPPRFLPLRYRDALAAKRIEEDLDLAEITPWAQDWVDSQIVIIAGEAGGGLSSAVLWLLDNRYLTDATLLPVRIAFDSMFSQNGIERALKAAARSAGVQGEMPPLLIGVDDVHTRGRGLSHLMTYLAQHPQHHAVLACKEEHSDAVAKAAHAAGMSYSMAFLGPFGAKQVRSLIQLLVGPGSDDLVDPIYAVLHSQELPRTPFILTALIAVIVDLGTTDISTMNQSALLDSYVSLLLGRDDVGDSDQLAMDRKRREHLLASYAAQLIREKAERMPRLAAEEYLAGWFRAKGWGLASSPGRVLDSLIQRGVLFQNASGEVSFRERALFHLFTAKWMVEDLGFRKEILDQALLHPEAVGHAAALVRSNAEILATVVEILEASRERFADATEASLFDSIRTQEGWTKFAPTTDVLEHTLEVEPEQGQNAIDPAARDARLDAYSENLDASDQEPMRLDGPDHLLVASVGLATSVLRSSELVDDVELKSYALREVILGWSEFAGLVGTADLGDSIRDFLEAHEDELEDSDIGDLDKVARLMLTFGLLVGVEFALGTVHLTAVINELIADEELMSESGPAMFITLLYFHAHQGASAQRLRALYEAHGDHPIVVQSVRAWAQWAYEEERNKHNRDLLEALLVDIYAAANAEAGGDRRVSRGAIAEKLRQVRLRRVAARAQVDRGGLDELDTGPNVEP